VDENHLALLTKRVDFWNQWRQENPEVKPDFSGANLRRVNLRRANLSSADLRKANLCRASLGEANLRRADLSGADLRKANLGGADLSGANLRRADLRRANFGGADLREVKLAGADLRRASLGGADLREVNLSGLNLHEAHLAGANLRRADLRKANLMDANLSGTSLVNAKLNGAILTNCSVYGISAWGLLGVEEAEQKNLVITPENESVITVDNLETAQFIYLLLNSAKIRHVIDTITSKVVLILGRFTPERKAILDAIRKELRERDYLPILFDFEKPTSRDLTETISTLAHMSRFVIADITDARSIPQELERIVPNLPSVPIKPILLDSSDEYGMFEHFKNYPWVLGIFRYRDFDDLLQSLEERVILPAEDKAKERLKNP
jgi:uncharacterized protein YjbI with pentapeptide repeats